jgi:uroporphyrinogen decarboxylase
MAQRASVVEHPFGTLKRWFGWDHFLVRGFQKVGGEMALMVLGYNLTRVINIAREESPELLIFYHCDGDFTQLIPDLVDIGVNVINPIQPDCMDGAAIKQEFGDRLAMWGTAGSAGLWDRGTPDQIRSEVRRCIEALGPQGLLLAPAYDIDFAPFENIVAFIEAVEEFGGN